MILTEIPMMDAYAKQQKVSNYNITYFKPSQINVASNYRMLVDINETLEIHGWIKIVFPDEFTMPDVPRPKHSEQWDHALDMILTSIYLGTSPCTKCQGLPIIKTKKRKNPEFIQKYGLDSENSIQFWSHIELNPNGPYDPIPITMADRTGILNPETPGFYKIGIQTESEPDTVWSNPIKVVKSQTSPATVVPSNPSIGETSGYNIAFNVGEGGSIDARESRITLVYPKSFKLPNLIPSGIVKVNGRPVNIEPSIFQLGSTISMITPVSIENNSEVNIQIPEKAGIVNTITKGKYRIKIYTNFEVEPTESNEFEIIRAGQKPLVVPPWASQMASYKFSIDFPKKVQENDLIELTFPSGTVIPSFISADSILIDGQPCKLKPRSIPEERKVQVYFPRSFDPGAVMLEFTQKAKLKNPENPGKYSVQFMVQGSEAKSLTDSYDIIIKMISISTINVTPLNAKIIATWSIEGSLAFTGDLNPGDMITLTFPPSTVIPDAIPSESITINGLQIQSATGSSNVLSIKLQTKLVSGSDFKIVITPQTGIVSPSTSSADFRIKIVTTNDTIGGDSEKFFIAPPMPVTTLLIRPTDPTGKNGWYTGIAPDVDFTCTSPTATIKVWWNHKIESALNWTVGSWSPLADAQRVDELHWQAIDTYGTEDVKTYTFKVDTIFPTFTISSPIGGEKALTKLDSFKISGVADATELAMYDDPEKLNFVVPSITVNGQKIPVVAPDPKGDSSKVPNAGAFEYMVKLVEGVNNYEVVAEDEAGNKITKKVEITKDTISPDITVTKPAVGETSNCFEIEVEGKTEPGATVAVKGGQNADVEPDGTFYFSFRPKIKGPNEVELIVTDTIGNTKTTKHTIWWGTLATLKIGAQPTKNGLEADPPQKSLPYINKKGSTMVPMRYLAENLMGGIAIFDSKSKKVIITLTNGTVLEHVVLTTTLKKTPKGGKPQVIDTKIASEIVSGSTFLPMRAFIEEGLGIPRSDLKWDPVTKTAIIQFPPDPGLCKK
jgi:hypothetical protein